MLETNPWQLKQLEWHCNVPSVYIFLSTRRNRVLTKSSTNIPQWALVHRSFAAPKSILFMVWELSLVFAVVLCS